MNEPLDPFHLRHYMTVDRWRKMHPEAQAAMWQHVIQTALTPAKQTQALPEAFLPPTYEIAHLRYTRLLLFVRWAAKSSQTMKVFLLDVACMIQESAWLGHELILSLMRPIPGWVYSGTQMHIHLPPKTLYYHALGWSWHLRTLRENLRRS